MKNEKFRCTECGAFEVVYHGKSADPFNTNSECFVCKKCGHKYTLDSGINLINHKTINTFPNPNTDMNVEDSFTKRIKEKRGI